MAFFEVIKSFRFAVGAASNRVSLALDAKDTGLRARNCRITNVSTDLLIGNFGDSAVVANPVATGGALAAGNFHIPPGRTIEMVIPGSATHLAAISVGALTPDLFIDIGW